MADYSDALTTARAELAEIDRRRPLLAQTIANLEALAGERISGTREERADADGNRPTDRPTDRPSKARARSPRSQEPP